MPDTCRFCSTEILFGPLATDVEKLSPLCSSCARRAPATGFWDEGPHDVVIGLDEVGWGALAGPLMVGAVTVPRGWTWPGLRDSKVMESAELERIADQLIGRVGIHVETMLVREFEALGAGPALRMTHNRAAWAALRNSPRALVIIDGKQELHPTKAWPAGVTCLAEIDADDHIPAVMAAAICAKVTRDRYMRGLHHVFPIYEWNDNVGYAGKNQIERIKTYGATPLHRQNYNPLKTMLAEARANRQLPLPFTE